MYLSDVLPTAWQAVVYADVPPGGSVAVLGLGPIGDMCTRVAAHRGAGQVIGIDLVPERLARAAGHGVQTYDLSQYGDQLVDAVRDTTDGRGPDSVIDAVGMEAHGSAGAKAAQTATGLRPDALASVLMKKAGVDKLGALKLAIELVRRGGVSPAFPHPCGGQARRRVRPART